MELISESSETLHVGWLKTTQRAELINYVGTDGYRTRLSIKLFQVDRVHVWSKVLKLALTALWCLYGNASKFKNLWSRTNWIVFVHLISSHFKPGNTKLWMCVVRGCKSYFVTFTVCKEHIGEIIKVAMGATGGIFCWHGYSFLTKLLYNRAKSATQISSFSHCSFLLNKELKIVTNFVGGKLNILVVLSITLVCHSTEG